MSLFLPKVYKKELRVRKLGALVFAFCLLLTVVMVTGLIFLLPSYFNLIFSKTDLLRRLDAQEDLLARRDLEGLEKEILLNNNFISRYVSNESRRYSFAGILKDVSAAVPQGVSFSRVAFGPASEGGFKIMLDGNAATRNGLISFVENVRALSHVDSVESPISNLLKELDVKFNVNININKEFYFYEGS